MAVVIHIVSDDSRTGVLAAGQALAFVVWQGISWLLCHQQQQSLHQQQAPAAILRCAVRTARLCEIIVVCQLAA
jgi:hypothetical protein